MCSLGFALLLSCQVHFKARSLSLSDNDFVLFGTCNQVQLSVYVYVFFFFPKQVFGFTQALRTFSAEPNTMLWFKRHCLGILQSVDLLNMMQLTHILSRFKLTTYAVSRSLAAGNCFRKPRHPAVRNFDQFSRNSSINSPQNTRYLFSNLKRLEILPWLKSRSDCRAWAQSEISMFSTPGKYSRSNTESTPDEYPQKLSTKPHRRVFSNCSEMPSDSK